MAGEKKRGKSSKAAKEKQKKQEEERRQREEEEARLLAEQEELKRLEEEQKQQEEQQRLELKDLERREDELRELRHLLEENQNAVSTWGKEQREKAKWDRYMRCDGSPDPSVPHEINSFISMWEEDADFQIGPVLASCSLALQLIEELEVFLSDMAQTEESEREAQRHQETIRSLQGLIHSKLNKATEELLKRSSVNTDMDTGNIRTVIRDANVTLYLWANLSNTQRFKEHHFEDVGLEFKLPKELAVSDVVIRILHTHFDHLSHMSRERQNDSWGPTKSVRPCLLSTEAEETGEEETEEEEVVEESMDSTECTGEDKQSVRPEDSKTAMSAASQKDSQRSAVPKEPEEEEREDERRDGVEDEAAPGSERHSSSSQELEMVTMETDVVDLQQYTPLGGVFFFNAFRLPPQSRLVNGWDMREILDTGLQNFSYPVDQSRLHSAISENQDEMGALSSSPIGVTVTIPDSVVLLEDPLVARWDPVGCHWRKDRISDITYNKALGKVSFQIDGFYTFTLLQDTYVNMPFQAWELRPVGPNSALLTITAAVSEVGITIKEHQCMLTSIIGSDLPNVLGQWMKPSALQRAMSCSGVNIFVNECSDQYVSINVKDLQTEQAVYRQMALLSSAVAFSWSRWNSNCGQEQLVVQACEHLQEGPVPEGAWSLYLIGPKRSQQLQMEEESESFLAALDMGSEFHSTFLHMLRDSMSESGHARAQDASPLFVDCVLQLLLATRVLTYS